LIDRGFTWAIVIPEVACAPNRHSISGLVDKVLRYVIIIVLLLSFSPQFLIHSTYTALAGSELQL